jgi:hypothetical protein
LISWVYFFFTKKKVFKKKNDGESCSPAYIFIAGAGEKLIYGIAPSPFNHLKAQAINLKLKAEG